MKKNLIALAVAGALAAPLAAQAEVTVSGVLQAELVNVSADDFSGAQEGLYLTDGMSNGGAQNNGGVGGIFFSAAEDLGGGLKAVAKYGLDVTGDGQTAQVLTATNLDDTVTVDGTNYGLGAGFGPVKTRDAYVGLSGGFGTVLAGRMSTPYKSSTVKWDPFLGTFMQARGNGGMSGGVTGHSSYLDNVVAYANQFGNAKFVAGIGLDEAPDVDGNNETNGEHALTAAVNVPVGPVEVAVAYLDVSDYAGAFGNDASAVKLGVKWNSGPITVAGQYEGLDKGLGDKTFIYLTGSYEMGANTFSASYGNEDPDGSDNNTDYFAIGMNHAFSKTTSAHLGYRATMPEVDDSDVSVLGAGLRVSF